MDVVVRQLGAGDDEAVLAGRESAGRSSKRSPRSRGERGSYGMWLPRALGSGAALDQASPLHLVGHRLT